MILRNFPAVKPHLEPEQVGVGIKHATLQTLSVAAENRTRATVGVAADNLEKCVQLPLPCSSVAPSAQGARNVPLGQVVAGWREPPGLPTRNDARSSRSTKRQEVSHVEIRDENQGFNVLGDPMGGRTYVQKALKETIAKVEDSVNR